MFEKWQECPVCKSQSQWDYDAQVCGLCSNLKSEVIAKAHVMIMRIQEIRKDNNAHWMDLMRVAFDKAPLESLEIMKLILEKDEQVTAEVRKLVEAFEGDRHAE